MRESLSLEWPIEIVLGSPEYSDPPTVSWKFACLDYYPLKNSASNFKMY